MNSIDKICPLCNKEILDNDNDVMTCPDCGVNYHKTCWEMNGGCLTSDCNQNPANKKIVNVENTIKCPKCGFENNSNSSFCSKCGCEINSSISDSINLNVPKKVKKKSKKKIIIISAVATVLVIILVIVGVFTHNTFFVSNIELSTNELNLEIDSTRNLSYTITPESAIDKSVTWTSSDTKIAEVDENGNVSALSEGTVTITATTSSGNSDECTINVTQKSLKTIYNMIGGDDFFCKLSYDGSYMEIDTNPYDIDDYYSSSATQMIQDANNALGLPTSIWAKMQNTSALDGRVNESYGDISVSWKYHPDQGLDVVYEYVK